MNNEQQTKNPSRKRLSDFLFILWAGGAALLSYSLVYALRKPYMAIFAPLTLSDKNIACFQINITARHVQRGQEAVGAVQVHQRRVLRQVQLGDVYKRQARARTISSLLCAP